MADGMCMYLFDNYLDMVGTSETKMMDFANVSIISDKLLAPSSKYPHGGKSER